MQFNSLPIKDALEIVPDPRKDDRGFFARVFCSEMFKEHIPDFDCVQMNHSKSALRGTLRGLHYQLAPFEEIKILKCIRGKIYDVILDIRLDSPTFGKSIGIELSEDNMKMVVVPKGCAHGFLTLTDNSEVMYMVSAPYSSELERGIRWNDPTFSVKWPEMPRIISERDQNHPNFDHFHHLNVVSVS